MAAITLKDSSSLDSFNVNSISAICNLNLPTYARPIFIRLKQSLDTTSTFKHVKGDLVKEVRISFVYVNILLTY